MPVMAQAILTLGQFTPSAAILRVLLLCLAAAMAQQRWVTKVRRMAME